MKRKVFNAAIVCSWQYGNCMQAHLIFKSIAMTNNEILQTDLLDILFENRNKSYGAYTLRKNYNYRMRIALMTALSVALLFTATSFFKKGKRENRVNSVTSDTLALRIIEFPEEPPPPEPPAPPQPAQADFQTIVIAPDNEVIEPIPDQDRLEREIIGNRNVVSEIFDDRIRPIVESTVPAQPVTNETPANDFVPDEKPAMFPGGELAWIKFLQRYLQTPDDLSAGERVEVYVRFRIETDGTLSGFEIVKSGGSLFDKEVLRVMKKMPKWIPAMQNRKAVAVSFTQPVIFLGVEE